MAAKATSWWRSIPLRSEKAPLLVTEEQRCWLAGRLKGLVGLPVPDTPSLKNESHAIVHAIQEETSRFNRNNVTRTAAYLEVYNRHPELHWALLAHVISRNGGWSMTDLRGEWLSELLAPQDARRTFRMLEASNALIFRDAYPQLLLYSESRRLGRPLFELLPRFDVSVFMKPFWELFWRDGSPVPLSLALIINEQNVIERRVVQDPFYQEKVLGTLAFRSQPIAQSNQLLMPLRDRKGVFRLAGRVLERFGRLDERIEFGKSFYSLLFGYPRVWERALAFARSIEHTGSRADYWPHLFTSTNRNGAPPGLSGQDAAYRPPWYSPRLNDAWDDQPLRPVSEGDWFQDLSVLDYLKQIRWPFVIDMTKEHVFGQRKLQATVRIGNLLRLDGR